MQLQCSNGFSQWLLSIRAVFFRPRLSAIKPEDLLDVLPAEATCLTAFAEAAEVEEALKSLEL